jgi:hypothetical protein
MAALERLAHHVRVARAVERVVGTAVGRVHDGLHDLVVAHFLRIDEVRHAEVLGHLALGRIDVDADDAIGADQLRALDDIEADAAEAEDDDVGARLHLSGVDHRADTGRHAAADVADLVERGVLADLRERDLGHDGEVRERRATHVVVQLLAAQREAAGAVRHQALALRRADRGAQVRLAAEAGLALPAFRRVQRNHMIARLQRRDALTHFPHDARALVSEDRREQPFGVLAIERVGVRVAHARSHDLHQHFPGSRTGQIHLMDLERAIRGDGDCSASLHGGSFVVIA